MRLILALLAATSLTACASRLNPVNWFGSAKSEPVAAQAAPAPAVDPRPLVSQVTKADLDRVAGGVMLTATGLPMSQGWWKADLVPDQAQGLAVDGTLTLRFVAAAPVSRQASSTAQSRELTAGRFIPDADLAGVRRIVVLGDTNRMTLSR